MNACQHCCPVWLSNPKFPKAVTEYAKPERTFVPIPYMREAAVPDRVCVCAEPLIKLV